MDHPKNHQLVEATVVYLVEEVHPLPRICLAQKKQDIHKNDGQTLEDSKKINGYGGKKEISDLSIPDCAIRELYTESGVRAKKEDLIEIAQIQFFWPGNTTERCDMDVTFYMLKKYEGEPIETKEMGPPQFFTENEVPYDSMNVGDQIIIRNGMRGFHTRGKISTPEKGSRKNTTDLHVIPR